MQVKQTEFLSVLHSVRATAGAKEEKSLLFRSNISQMLIHMLLRRRLEETVKADKKIVVVAQKE